MNKENKFYVYALLDPRKPGEYKYGQYVFEYEPFYIGKGARDRMYQHSTEAYNERDIKKGYKSHKCNKIRKIKRKTGRDPIVIKVQNYTSEDSAFKYEKKLIILIGRQDLKRGPLTNRTNGGDGVRGFIMDVNHRRRLSEAKKGEKNPNHRNNTTEEQKRKLRELMTGNNNSNYGLTRSKQVKKKMCINNPMNRPVKINDKIFISVSDAARYLNKPRTTISNRLLRNTKGYREN